LILRKLIILASLIIGLVTGAAAQVPPYVYPVTLGTSSVQILPVNPARKRVMFINPNATALLAVCPLGPTRNTNVAVVAAINGAGCRTILPYDAFTVDGSSGGSGPPLYMPAAWVGIASAASSALTIMEFE
jgi:flavoprotein